MLLVAGVAGGVGYVLLSFFATSLPWVDLLIGSAAVVIVYLLALLIPAVRRDVFYTLRSFKEALTGRRAAK